MELSAEFASYGIVLHLQRNTDRLINKNPISRKERDGKGAGDDRTVTRERSPILAGPTWQGHLGARLFLV